MLASGFGGREMNGVSLTILHLLPCFKRYVNYLLGYTRSNVQTLQMRIKNKEVEETQIHVSAEQWIYRTVVEYTRRVRRINRTSMTQHWDDCCTKDYMYLVQTPEVVYLSTSTRISGHHHHHHHHHHQHQGLDLLIRSVFKVTTARANASSVFQLFSFIVVCSGMISKGFGFVAFFASAEASSVCIHLSCLVCL